jgi:hypothetical protein
LINDSGFELLNVALFSVGFEGGLELLFIVQSLLLVVSVRILLSAGLLSHEDDLVDLFFFR